MNNIFSISKTKLYKHNKIKSNNFNRQIKYLKYLKEQLEQLEFIFKIEISDVLKN